MADDLLIRRRLQVLPALLAATAVVLQIAYPLTHGLARDRLTVGIVLVFAAAGVAHAATSRGPAGAVGLLAVTAVPGFAVEVLGVHTGVPFGSYHYGSSLGGHVLGVPPVIALAWTMLAWPAAIAARHLVRGPVPRVVVGAWALASADLFLDPQMVAAHRWTWAAPAPHLPGVPDVPLTDYAGWFAVALLLSAALQALLNRTPDAGDAVPIALYLWLYLGWIVALAVFLGLGAAAAWGAVGMGVVAVPLAITCRRP
jgi:putative membrane protein